MPGERIWQQQKWELIVVNKALKLSKQILVYHIDWHQESCVVSISWKFTECFLYVQHGIRYLGKLKKDILFFHLEILLLISLTNKEFYFFCITPMPLSHLTKWTTTPQLSFNTHSDFHNCLHCLYTLDLFESGIKQTSNIYLVLRAFKIFNNSFFLFFSTTFLLKTLIICPEEWSTFWNWLTASS